MAQLCGEGQSGQLVILAEFQARGGILRLFGNKQAPGPPFRASALCQEHR